MMVKVVTDSCSDIPQEIVQELGISVIPLHVYFGDEEFQDGVNLTPDEFYNKLAGGMYPRTTQPSPVAFIETFKKLATETKEIFSVHLSKKLSGSYNSASIAQAEVEQICRVEVVDSLMASMGVGLLAIKAAKAAIDGANLDQIKMLLEEAIPKTHFIGALDTLEYLHKGGRLGKGQALLGSVLNMKPLLHIKDGEVYPLERTRGREKALTRLCQLVGGFHDIEDMAVMYATTPDEAERLRDKLAWEGTAHMARIGPTIGTYMGPGALAVALIERG